MNTFNAVNDTFNAVLDAASAGVSSVTPRTSTKDVTHETSKSQTFVSFDDIVSTVPGVGGVSLESSGGPPVATGTEGGVDLKVEAKEGDDEDVVEH